MRTVLVYNRSLLPYSETFIREQILAYNGWRGLLVGRELLDQLPLDDLDLCILDRDQGYLANTLTRARWYLGRPPGANLLRKEEPALLHVHFGTNAPIAAPLARLLNIPMVVTLHGFDINTDRGWWEAGHGGWAYRRYPTRLLALAQEKWVHFVAVADTIRSEAISYGIPAEKISTRYIGVDTTKFSPGGQSINHRDSRILFVGRLVEKKGCEYLVRSFAHIHEAVPNARLIILGDGPLRHSLEQLVASLNIGSFVQFRGSVASSEVKKEIDRARVFCLPSVRADNGDAEGLPISLLEAQACGVPVVTSAKAGVIEGIEEGKTGLAFSEKNVEDLADKVIRILQDAKLSIALSQRAPQFIAERFDIHTCTRALEDLYDLCISSNPAKKFAEH